MRNNWIKKILLIGLNVGVLGFLFFAGNILFSKPASIRSQAGLIIPDDSLIYQAKIKGLQLSKDKKGIDLSGQGEYLSGKE